MDPLSRPVFGEYSSIVRNTIASSSESRPFIGDHISGIGNAIIASSAELRPFLCAVDNYAVGKEKIVGCYTNPLEDGWEIFETAELSR